MDEFMKYLVDTAISEICEDVSVDMKNKLEELGVDADVRFLVKVKHVDFEKVAKKVEKEDQEEPKQEETTIKILLEDIDNG